MHDWIDDLHWGAIALGAGLAVILQVIVTLVVLRPLNLSLDWSAVALVELCIVVGAFLAGWRARHAALINGLIAALITAVISLAATVIRSPGALSLPSVAFLFGTFAAMGVLGGMIAWQVLRWQQQR